MHRIALIVVAMGPWMLACDAERDRPVNTGAPSTLVDAGDVPGNGSTVPAASGTAIEVRGVLASRPPDCNAWLDDPDAPVLERGTLDLSITNSYVGMLQLRLAAQSPPPARIMITASVGDAEAQWEENWNTELVPPIGDALRVQLLLMHSAFAAGFKDTALQSQAPIEATSTLDFQSEDGASIGRFTFPINLCHGCLLSFPEGVPETDVLGHYMCQWEHRPCSPGRDEAFTCYVTPQR